MSAAGYRWAREAGRVAVPAALLWLAMLQGGAYAQAAGATAQAGAQPGSGTGTEMTLDRVAAMVNGDLILESDLDAEERFTAFQPFSEALQATREELLNRLIDRTLILQQMALQPEAPIGDAEVDEQLDDGLGGHRRAPVGMERELVAIDLVLGEGLGDERLGQLPGLGGRDHPAHDIATEDVDDHVQLVVDAPLGAAQLGDVPGPDLERLAGDELRLLLGGMGALAAALPVLAD